MTTPKIDTDLIRAATHPDSPRPTPYGPPSAIAAMLCDEIDRLRQNATEVAAFLGAAIERCES